MRVVIIEDEEPARKLLQIYLKEHGDCEVVGEAADGFEGFRLIQELKPDVVFLDIQMPRITGLELLDLLESPPLIVFATAYDHFAVQAFDRNACDYLLKPYGKERFRQALDRVRQRLAKANSAGPSPEQSVMRDLRDQPGEQLQRIAVKVRNKVHVIPVDQITHIEAEGDYVYLHTAEGRFLKEVTMKYLESHLPAQHFLRIHRSAIVNLLAIKGLEQKGPEAWMVVLQSGLQVKASGEGRKQLKKILGL